MDASSETIAGDGVPERKGEKRQPENDHQQIQHCKLPKMRIPFVQ
jgi:hypothetical protein